MKTKKKKIKNRYKSRYQAGGMYGSNTVSSAGQGNPTSTANIVYAESNPAILEAKLEAQKEEEKELMRQSSEMATKVEEMDQQAEIDMQTTADNIKAKDQATSSTIKSGLELGKQAGLIDKDAGSLGVKDAIKEFKNVRAANQAAKAAEAFQTAKTTMSGIKTAQNVKTGFDLAKSTANVSNIAKQGLQTGKTLQQGFQLGKTATGVGGTATQFGGTAANLSSTASTGSAVGSGLSALNNANVYALAANYAGKGIKSIYDDDDATTWTAGEATGDTLSKAGEYAGYGAMLGSVVPGVGNALGAGVGAIIGTGVGIYQGLTGRKKARKQEAKAEEARNKKVGKYNKDLTSRFLAQQSNVQAARLKQKQYSGYDLGKNVVAQLGGMRMGMPRYGQAA